MGRHLKRVPLDFDWEINKTWSGYVNPHPVHECKECDGTGESKELHELEDEWYGWNNQNWQPNPYRDGFRYNANAWKHNLSQEDVDALLEADRLWDFTRIPLNEEQKEVVRKRIEEGHNDWLPYDNGYIPTPEEVNKWAIKGMGHDSINCHVVIKARLEREGKSSECHKCGGSGVDWQSNKAREYYENWEPYDPPLGDGYQLWEDTTEGSPVSPVFETLDALCQWCENNASVFADAYVSKEEWKEMLSNDNVHMQQGNVIFL